MAVPCSYLRVYEPLGAFTDVEQKQWRAAVDDGLALDRAAAGLLERRYGRQAVVRVPPLPVEDPEAIVVRVEDGVPFVCPLDLRQRCWEALTEFCELLPEPITDAFLPGVASSGYLDAYERWRRTGGDREPHVLSARWQVPLRWFVPFEPAEKQVVVDPGGGRSLLYVTAMSRARRRVARALAVLRRTLEDGPVVEGVESVGRWLEEFHPHSYLELDYAGLAEVLDDEWLTSDDSAADVADAVRAIGRGDVDGAGAAYERVMTRWRAISALESAN